MFSLRAKIEVVFDCLLFRSANLISLISSEIVLAIKESSYLGDKQYETY